MPDRRGADAPPRPVDRAEPMPSMDTLLAAGEAARALSTPPAERDRPDDGDDGDDGDRKPDRAGRRADQRHAA